MSPTPTQPDRPGDRPDRDRDAGLPGRPGDRPGGAHPDQDLPEGEKPKPGTKPGEPTQLPADTPPPAKPK